MSLKVGRSSQLTNRWRREWSYRREQGLAGTRGPGLEWHRLPLQAWLASCTGGTPKPLAVTWTRHAPCSVLWYIHITAHRLACTQTLLISSKAKKPYRLGSATSAAVTAQGSGGTQACTAGEKGVVLISFSSSSTCSPPVLGFVAQGFRVWTLILARVLVPGTRHSFMHAPESPSSSSTG